MYCVTFKQTFVVFLTCHFWPHLSSSTTDGEYDSTDHDPLIGTENPLVNGITPVNLPCEDLLMGQYPFLSLISFSGPYFNIYCLSVAVSPSLLKEHSCSWYFYVRW